MRVNDLPFEYLSLFVQRIYEMRGLEARNRVLADITANIGLSVENILFMSETAEGSEFWKAVSHAQSESNLPPIPHNLKNPNMEV